MSNETKKEKIFTIENKTTHKKLNFNQQLYIDYYLKFYKALINNDDEDLNKFNDLLNSLTLEINEFDELSISINLETKIVTIDFKHK